MNIYKSLNLLINYIEENIKEDLTLTKMAKVVGVNPHILSNLFSLLANIGIAEYIRLRRLSLAAIDLQNGMSVMEVAVLYQYTSAIAFSRAFTKFYGIKPSEVKKKNIYLKSYPILQFNDHALNLSYRIEKHEKFSLYGVKKITNEKKIAVDAPNFFKETKKKYQKICESIPYAMVLYEKRFSSSYLEYWCLYKEPYDEFSRIDFPESKWLIFSLHSRNEKDIQNLIHEFYTYFFPKNKYKLRDLPELEVYLENETMEFWVAIF